MRYFIDIAFNGTKYHGWQIQPGDITVQEVVEHALGTLFRRPIPVTGAGRTDAGVHARCMPAHFDTPDALTPDKCAKLIRSINAICRPDIVIRHIVQVDDNAHARFDATNRTYRYFVNTAPDPFNYHASWFCPTSLDFDTMNQAACDLIGTHDFTSFAKLHTDNKTNICTVTQAQWVQCDDTHWYFQISADRFLRNMVRAVVGTLIQIGKNSAPTTHIADTMAMMDRCAAGTSMPAHALFLWDVKYPYPTW